VTPTLADVRAWDAADPLRGFREQFILPDGVIYMVGNSLGPLPRAARDRMSQAVEVEWGQGLVRSWNDADWIGAPRRIGAKIAGLIGAAPEEVIVADSTSVNLYKLLLAALLARPGRSTIVTEVGNFPTDLYVAQGLAASHPGAVLRAVAPTDVLSAIGPDTAVVMLTQVHYKSAARWDMRAVTEAAHAAGALMLWDLSHSAGAIPVDLAGHDVDLAVGCGYKFLNGGPGAPSYVFVARRHQAAFASPLAGWMGHAAPFEMADDYRSAGGMTRWLTGTPPVLSLLALEAGVDLMRKADASERADKARRLWELLAGRIEARCGGGFTLLTPRDAEQRGSHLALAHPEGYRIMHTLIGRGVVGDYRAPDVIRFAVTPLYQRYEDIWNAAEVLAEIMAEETWRAAPAPAHGQVT
jgi:kynureninase